MKLFKFKILPTLMSKIIYINKYNALCKMLTN